MISPWPSSRPPWSQGSGRARGGGRGHHRAGQAKRRRGQPGSRRGSPGGSAGGSSSLHGHAPVRFRSAGRQQRGPGRHVRLGGHRGGGRHREHEQRPLLFERAPVSVTAPATRSSSTRTPRASPAPSPTRSTATSPWVSPPRTWRPSTASAERNRTASPSRARTKPGRPSPVAGSSTRSSPCRCRGGRTATHLRDGRAPPRDRSRRALQVIFGVQGRGYRHRGPVLRPQRRRRRSGVDVVR